MITNKFCSRPTPLSKTQNLKNSKTQNLKVPESSPPSLSESGGKTSKSFSFVWTVDVFLEYQVTTWLRTAEAAALCTNTLAVELRKCLLIFLISAYHWADQIFICIFKQSKLVLYIPTDQISLKSHWNSASVGGLYFTDRVTSPPDWAKEPERKRETPFINCHLIELKTGHNSRLSF